mgnify:CR=1 FL=1
MLKTEPHWSNNILLLLIVLNLMLKMPQNQCALLLGNYLMKMLLKEFILLLNRLEILLELL